MAAKLGGIPTLTLSGQASYGTGLLAAGMGIQLGRPALTVFGLLLFVPVVLAWIFAWWRLRPIEIRIRRPARARAFEPSPLEVTLSTTRSVTGLVIADPARPVLGPCLHVERLLPGPAVSIAAQELFTRRGRVRPGLLSLATARPLGLARAERACLHAEEILVLPAIGRLRGSLRSLAESGVRELRSPRSRAGDGAEILQLRPWRPGDPFRRVHWRSTIRTGEVMVRDLEDERGGDLVIGFGARAEPGQQRALEAAISCVASLLRQAAERGREVTLLLAGCAPLRVPRHQRSALDRAEEELALLSPPYGWPEWIGLPDPGRPAQRVLVHPGTLAPPAVPPGTVVIDVADALRNGHFRLRGGSAA